MVSLDLTLKVYTRNQIKMTNWTSKLRTFMLQPWQVWLSWLECRPINTKGPGFDSSSKHIAGLWVWSLGEAAIAVPLLHQCSSPRLSLPLFPLSKVSRQVLGRGLKTKESICAASDTIKKVKDNV